MDKNPGSNKGINFSNKNKLLNLICMNELWFISNVSEKKLKIANVRFIGYLSSGFMNTT